MTNMQTLNSPASSFEKIADFIEAARHQTPPENVLHTAKLYVLDLIGVLAAADKLDAGRIARNHSARHWAAGEGAPRARMLFDGREVSLPGFGFAMATQIDNLDAHDGLQASKGHAGAALFPALAAFSFDSDAVDGRQALTAMVLGYEISYRAALALHGTVSDYHTSGAWNAIGCAAIGAVLREGSRDVQRHAYGIAEYHGPRSQMMREIANPSMLHDGTGWGAPTGIYALLIAEDGFTGAPAATLEFADAEFAWADIGNRWLTCEQYIKPYPICRWAHAPIDAVKALQNEYGFTHDAIEKIEIATFTESAELNRLVPRDTTIAQYSISWPVAAMLVRGKVGVDEVLSESFTDPDIVRLTGKCHVRIDPEIDAGFPERRQASVSITLKDDRVLQSGLTTASGGPVPQPTEQEVVAKYRAFAGATLPQDRVQRIETLVLGLDKPGADFKALMDEMIAPA